MITTRTADKLMSRATEMQAVSDFLYQEGMKEAAVVVSDAARKLACASADVREKIERYARAVHVDAEQSI